MKLITTNIEFELFQSINQCEEKIVIVSPFMSTRVVEKLVQVIKARDLHCTVVTRFDRKLFVDKVHSLDALEFLIENGIEVLALQSLHTKLYVLDNTKCFTGSANFTNKGLTANHEMVLAFDQQEVAPFVAYVDNLVKSIKDTGDWQITAEQLQIEREILAGYQSSVKMDKILTYTWGANVEAENTVRDEDLILSVAAGGTIHLIKENQVHAHPISAGYNYAPAKYITFREANGGVMDSLYRIDQMFSIDMKDWRTDIESIDIAKDRKGHIIRYIIERYKDFDFDKAEIYKFYSLSYLCNLPHKPRPPQNNAGGWMYTVGELRSGREIVYTVKRNMGK
ncbi:MULTISPECIES: phospholipase D family protein [unclassified Sporosarcina]|uniref:phospholipase D family protein n=1 Tax=unclassified Sporosarcina TaxID=2647733 RepID=UPI000C167D6E|nr:MULTISPECIES: phospholipase D family protein [unclassified Sporosarcina]PIC69889.1 hypothetical protein CSV77_11515 [Sporosarcina sp. P16b]PID25167.1 hypothetical protein CSV60_05935 [Sporosarcina sp. P7]